MRRSWSRSLPAEPDIGHRLLIEDSELDVGIFEQLLIGVSYTIPDPLFLRYAIQYKNLVVHTINGLIDESDIDFLSGNGLKLLILGYKDVGRGNIYRAEAGSPVKVTFHGAPASGVFRGPAKAFMGKIGAPIAKAILIARKLVTFMASKAMPEG